jgi:hypothetical protein
MINKAPEQRGRAVKQTPHKATGLFIYSRRIFLLDKAAPQL